MSSFKLPIFMIIGFSTLIMVVAASAQKEDNPTPPGLESYIPTKLEWLALELTAANAYDNLAQNSFQIGYIASGDNTILLSVGYLRNANRPVMELAVQYARLIVLAAKKRHSWDWVQIKEEYEMLNP